MEEKIEKLREIINNNPVLENYKSKISNVINEHAYNNLLMEIIEDDSFTHSFIDDPVLKTELQLLLNKYSNDNQYPDFNITQ